MPLNPSASLIEPDRSPIDVRPLLAALERGEFDLYYQPKVRMETSVVVGAEALLRWNHPTRGLLSAAAFLPALQDFRFARKVGEWGLARAREHLQGWQRQGFKAVPVSINIHPQHLTVPRFAEMFIDASEGMIDLEILEEGLSRNGEMAPVLDRLRRAGVRVALDDFGIGYSTLGRLAELPIDILKIDRSFVSALTRARAAAHRVRAQRILSTIISLAHICRFTTVAEGVESQAQFKALAELGCDESQGYLHSPAVSAESFAQFLRPKSALETPAVQNDRRMAAADANYARA